MRFKSLAVAVVTAAALSGTAFAADLGVAKAPIAPPTPPAALGFDYAFGIGVMSDYVFRGVSQSDRKPSATGYAELQYKINPNIQLYARGQMWKVNQPSNPFAEVDLIPGMRLTFGDFAVDFGAQYYLYPSNKDRYWSDSATNTFLNPSFATLPAGARCPFPGGFCATTAKDPSYWELFVKPSYNITPELNVGATAYYAPNWLNYNTKALYTSATAKYTFGETGFAISGEWGYMNLHSLKGGTAYNPFFAAPVKLPKYTTWNVGGSYTWNQFTLDLRYHGSTLNKNGCYLASADPSGNAPGQTPSLRSNWCGHRFAASLNIDLVGSKDVGFLPK